MPQKVSRSDPSGTKNAIDVATLDQVKAGKVVIELADGSDAVLGTVEQIIAGLVKDEVANLLRQKTIDLEYQGNENWITATGNNNLSVLRGGVDADAINAITDWAASYDIPSGTETDGALIVRLEKGANPNDYRLFNGIPLFNVGDFIKPGFITSLTYDYYLSSVSIRGRYATGETLVLQHHGGEGHSIFHGSAPEIESRIDDVVDDLAGKQNIRPVDIDLDHHYWLRGANEESVYFLEVTNMVTELLPDVDGISVLISGILVDNFAIALDGGDMAFPIEVSVAEATSINRILDPAQADLVVSVRFLNGTTVVHTVELPLAVVDEKPEDNGITDDERERLMPVLPPSHGRNGRILRFRGDEIDDLSWVQLVIDSFRNLDYLPSTIAEGTYYWLTTAIKHPSSDHLFSFTPGVTVDDRFRGVAIASAPNLDTFGTNPGALLIDSRVRAIYQHVFFNAADIAATSQAEREAILNRIYVVIDDGIVGESDLLHIYLSVDENDHYKLPLTFEASENGIRRYYCSEGNSLYNFMSRGELGVVFNVQRGNQFLVAAGWEDGGDMPKGLYTGDAGGNPYITGTLPALPILGSRHRKRLTFDGDVPTWIEGSRDEIDILTFDMNRGVDVDGTLPTNYQEWFQCYILVADETREDTHILRTKDLAQGNLVNIGRGDANFDWNSSTRVFSGKSSKSRFITISLL